MNSSCFDPIDPKCEESKRARLREIREQEKRYAKLICDCARNLQEREQVEIAKQREENARLLEQQNKERILQETIAFAKQLEEVQREAAEVAKQAQIMRDKKLVKQKEYECKANERFCKALLKLAEERNYRESLKPKHPNFYSSRIEREPLINDNAFETIEKAIEKRSLRNNRPKSTLLIKNDTDIIKKHKLTFLNVHSAKLVNIKVNKYDQKDNGMLKTKLLYFYKI